MGEPGLYCKRKWLRNNPRGQDLNYMKHSRRLLLAETFSSLALLIPRPTRADRYRPPSPVLGFSPTHCRHLARPEPNMLA